MSFIYKKDKRDVKWVACRGLTAYTNAYILSLGEV
jgi:hypothetical protein